MTETTDRIQILEMIERGQISAEEGLRLLQALNGHAESYQESAEQDDITATATPLSGEESELSAKGENPVVYPELIEAVAPPAAGETRGENAETRHTFPADARKWRQWWMLPLWIGVAITISGGFLMYWAQASSGIGLWFICASVPFLIGIAVMALAWGSRSAPWLHLRVQQKPGERPQRIAFSFPLPIRPTAWLLRNFGTKIPQLEGTSLDEMLLAVGETTSPENPIYVQVDEGDDGEKVEIFIG